MAKANADVRRRMLDVYNDHAASSVKGLGILTALMLVSGATLSNIMKGPLEDAGQTDYKDIADSEIEKILSYGNLSKRAKLLAERYDLDLDRFETKIVGDEYCSSKTQMAVDLIREKSSLLYDFVRRNIGIIDCAEQGSGISVWENPPRFTIGNKTRDGDKVWLAGSIVHDACHANQYLRYAATFPEEKKVPIELYSGEEAETECSGIQHTAVAKLGGTRSQLAWIKDALKEKFWEIPYDNRTW